MRDNIRFAVLNKGQDPKLQMAGAARELYAQRMNALVDVAEAKTMVMDVEFKLKNDISRIILSDEEYKKQKNVQDREAYLRKKLSRSFGLVQSHSLNLEIANANLEIARMNLSELRLQIDIMEMFVDITSEEGEIEFEFADEENDDGEGEGEIS